MIRIYRPGLTVAQADAQAKKDLHVTWRHPYATAQRTGFLVRRPDCTARSEWLLWTWHLHCQAALLRTGFELFGEDVTREHIFAIVRTMAVRIQPPQRIAVSQQRLRGYKATKKKETITINESPLLRDMAHVAGSLRIGINVPSAAESLFRELFTGIGYWGQASGLARCQHVEQEVPDPTSCIMPLRQVQRTQQVSMLFTALATEFRDDTVRWEEVMPALAEKQSRAIKPAVYVWPLCIREQCRSGVLLERCSIRRKRHLESMTANH